MKKPNVAIMGATGAVGAELLELLDERNFPLNSLKLLASARSAGKEITFRGETLIVEELTHDSFEGIDIVLASAGGSLSKEYAPSAVKAGAVVVDNTSHFRMDPEVPLVVPEINPEDIKWNKGIIANPNCSTILMVLALYPLHKRFKVKRTVVSTYQAASGAGALAMEELKQETEAHLKGETFENTVINQPYAFNLFPHNSPMTDNGYVEEELKMMKETAKIFHDDSKVTATCVRVPIMRAHSESLNIEFENPYTLEEAYELLKNAPGVELFEDREANIWATPLDVSGKDPVYVGRLRRDKTIENGLELWLVGDQVRKGAALNAVQIAELLLEN
jgi:aspartate-semialdehyde dehydrogenase